MADDDDLEYSETNVGSAQSQGVRKNISLKLKGRGRGGRGRKSVRGKKVPASKKATACEDEVQARTVEDISEEAAPEKQISDSNLDEVISKLETPSFSPMERVFPEPLHQNKKLRWSHKVNLIGEKVINPLIHCCEKCSLPILNYGRLIPCKHVFCYECAKKAEKLCPKCEDKIQRVEQTSLGTVFMCTFGGSRLGPVACGRTYLSQRDLQAHINHRHLKPSTAAASTTAATSTTPNSISHSSSAGSLTTNVNLLPAHPRDPRGHVHEILTSQTPLGSHVSHGHVEHRDQGDHSRVGVPSATLPSGNQSGQQRQYPHSPASYPSAIPVSNARPNLITVPIQDDSSSSSQHSGHPQPHSQQYSPVSGAGPHTLASVAQHTAPGSYPPPHAYQHPIGPATPAYSQTPPVTTQTFSGHPPPVHHPPLPPIHGGNVPLYSTPPPPVHHPPQTTYSTPPAAPPHSSHNMPPQRFPGGAANYDEGSYMQPPWNSGARASMPPPRPLAAPASSHNIGHIPTRGPTDQGYRPPYYQ